ncbi:putative AlkP superfamily pyrophosphatase or phosphodiesterase [Zymomonas mobilis]|uniref:nucleotide pyrophosphatase/phosphodiesterase family protein n=1 Tax=Zymomonas mobilis TaxID=542 RepID=UPI00026D89BF|nr:nucleotide pyrophosphatase/phosphodiesterase family protein [Zymomonas mobilis]AFN57373.1 Phosphodiesterase I [Zymomonas mobilis subsp. mobilis ATCC 29191]TQK78865.1 putative AlkP superfamily pyrophosphatase or phosphodiesterase [Zymomonas mobilis]TQL14700.1 putative AlkP superfamily pyrophosphatase or phosphodiesterase [Zymomonas mobilis]
MSAGYKPLKQRKPWISGILSLLLGCAGLSVVHSDAIAATAHTTAQSKTPLILISIDGFRADYIKRGLTPNLVSLAENGSYAKVMHPSFPSITFPNHYTLVTGLYPDHHGIVGNNMDDAHITPDSHFKMSDHQAVTDRRWWDEGEPLWVTAEKQGVVSATMFWPGSEADIEGVRPEMWRRFDSHVPFSERVDQVFSWLAYPEKKRPQFITLYFENVDHAGHLYGPDSQEVNDNLVKIDQTIGQLVQGLKQRGIKANLVIVSDHGMAATSSDRVVALNKILDPRLYHVVTGGAYAGIEPSSGHSLKDLEPLLASHDHMQCWPKQQIPARFHYGQNPRVPGVVCAAEVGWSIMGNDSMAAHATKGNHGYDNQTPEMGALFIANGPAFQKHKVIESMDNIDVQPLVAQVLKLKAPKGDSSLTASDIEQRFLAQ